MNIVNVGFIGLGNVGSKIATNILKGNFLLSGTVISFYPSASLSLKLSLNVPAITIVKVRK